ncbi:hypothetical protein XANCAGTX0491_001328 [Xanthoria calcicola]
MARELSNTSERVFVVLSGTNEHYQDFLRIYPTLDRAIAWCTAQIDGRLASSHNDRLGSIKAKTISFGVTEVSQEPQSPTPGFTIMENEFERIFAAPADAMSEDVYVIYDKSSMRVLWVTNSAEVAKERHEAAVGNDMKLDVPLFL